MILNSGGRRFSKPERAARLGRVTTAFRVASGTPSDLGYCVSFTGQGSASLPVDTGAWQDARIRCSLVLRLVTFEREFGPRLEDFAPGGR